NSTCVLVDEVVANSDWPAGDKIDKKTMERKDFSNWQTYLFSSVDVESGLNGTPKKENSEIVEDTTEEDVVEDDATENDITDDSTGGEDIEEDTTENDVIEDDITEEDIVDDGSGDDAIDDTVESEEDNIVPVLITEIQVNGVGGKEYVEIFNNSEEDINLCVSELDCYYLAYYAPNDNWNDASHLWKFEADTIILANGYYLIDIYGDNNGDWNVAEYADSKLSDLSGSLSLFHNNPVYEGEEDKTVEEEISFATNLKVDAVGWKSNEEDDTIVKEGDAFLITEPNKVLGRKWSGIYADNNDNATDFQLEVSSIRGHVPQPPDRIEDLVVENNPQQKNSVILSWNVPNDPDSDESTITYNIYYSKGSSIDKDNLININAYVSPIDVSEGETVKKYIVPDLYFGSTYYFAVMATDAENNVSLLSNEVEYIIDPAVHKKQAPYVDFARSDRTSSTGVTTETAGEVSILAQSEDERIDNDSLLSPVVIDENGITYFMGQKDGDWSLYAYNLDGTRKWKYKCDSQCGELVTLGKDGTIYFTRVYGIHAITPSGKLKWTQEFSHLYSKEIAIDSVGNVYVVASLTEGTPMLFVIDDRGTTYNRSVLFDINGHLPRSPIRNFSPIAIDSADYLYFSYGDTIFKCNNQGLVAERVILPKHNDKYDNRVVTSRINEVYISQSGNVLFSAYESGCCNYENSPFDVFYSLTNDLSEIIWSKDGYPDPIGVNDNEFYITFTQGYSREISAINILDGKVNWTKRWNSTGSPVQSPSKIVSADNGRIYFMHSSYVLGYDTGNMTDTDPTHDLIFSVNGLDPSAHYPVSFGNGYMYVPSKTKISRMLIALP
ncbi:MAG: hypothetical protein PHD31_02815, partial [Candidatus Pacebacteria bacterium]|nr:hypothetical protein [Candidatus Paceibacterota bacterium]